MPKVNVKMRFIGSIALQYEPCRQKPTIIGLCITHNTETTPNLKKPLIVSF